MPIVNIPAVIDHDYPTDDARAVSLVLATYCHNPQESSANRTTHGPVISTTIWPYYELDELAQDAGISVERVEEALVALNDERRSIWTLMKRETKRHSVLVRDAFELSDVRASKADIEELAEALDAARRAVRAELRVAA